MTAELNIHEEMQPLLAIKARVRRDLDAESQRQGWEDYGQAFKRPYPDDMEVSDEVFHREQDGERHQIPVRIYRPANAPSPSPLVLYFHGGGFVKGDLDSGDTVAWGIAEQTGAVVISVAYRLAPQHPYPAALHDAYAALCHAVENATSLAIDTDRIAVWGDSAGGNIATAMCMLSRDRSGPAIVAQALCYPCLSDELTTPSYSRYAENAGLSATNMNYYWDQYLGEKRPTSDGYAAPVKSDKLANLPPAHIHIAEFDVLADEGRYYVDALKEAGGVATLRVAPRMIHGFLRSRFDGPDSAAEFAAGCNFLKRYLFS